MRPEAAEETVASAARSIHSKMSDGAPQLAGHTYLGAHAKNNQQ
jgi:hypothetical protein